MNELRLPFTLNSEVSVTEASVECAIDNVICSHTIVDNSIIVVCDLNLGFHSLRINLLNNDIKIRINDALLDGVSVRQTLYTMYAIDTQTSAKRQTTVLSDYDTIIYLPFINPIAQWISQCAEKIPYALLSSGLYETYEVYYPTSVVIPDHYPKLLRDFFVCDFGFHTHLKVKDPYYKKSVPFAVLNNFIYYDEQVLADELLNNIEYLKSLSRKPKQTAYTPSENPWTVVDLIINSESDFNLDASFRADPTKLPNLYNFLKQLDIDLIVHAFIGILAPGEYITPHCDTYQELGHISELVGCSQIYIPINFKPGNLFKFSNIGLLPLDGPILINNHNFAHALINDSNEYRFGLGINGSKFNGK
jgi:hypothetical protein